MSEGRIIRDLIYFDFDKTASIASQLFGGLTKEVRENYAKGKEGSGGFRAHFFNAGIKASESESTTVVLNVHHDLLVDTEQLLSDANMLVDLNEEFQNTPAQKESLHKVLREKPCVRVEGVSAFQDFGRVKRYLDGMIGLIPLLEAITMHQQGKSNEFYHLQGKIQDLEEQIEESGDRNRKKSLQKKLQGLMSQKENVAGGATTQQAPAPMLKAFGEFLDLIMPNRNHMAVQPFDYLGAFKVYSNLKRDCFVDSDTENVLFHYGSKPNVKLTVFGLVASVPESRPAPVSLFDTDTLESEDDALKINQVFSQVSEAIEPLEKFGQVTRYPSVTVYPLAVYRAIRE